MFSKCLGVFVGLAFVLFTHTAFAVPVEHRIIFTQTYFHPIIDIRNLGGSFFLDDSVFGLGFENRSYGPFDSEIALLTGFTVTVSGSVPSWPAGLYKFDLTFTRNIVSPAISSIIKTGTDGEVIDIQGGLKLVGTLNEVILGREGKEAEYVDIVEVDPFNSVVGSSGIYSVERVSVPPVPVPAALPLFGTGLAVIGFIGWRRKRNVGRISEA